MTTLNYLKHLKNLKQKRSFLYQTLFNFLMAIFFIKKGRIQFRQNNSGLNNFLYKNYGTTIHWRSRGGEGRRLGRPQFILQYMVPIPVISVFMKIWGLSYASFGTVFYF